MSKRLTALGAEVEDLRDQFLPDPFDPLGVYPDATRVQAHARAFLVLSHAAIETYIEDVAKEVARAAEQVWTKHGRVAPPLSFLLAALAERLKLPAKLPVAGVDDGPQRLQALMTKLFQSYYKRIGNNHGIKESNVLELFGPLGVPASAFGSTLVPNLEALGSLRGIHAHNSTKAVKAVLDPEDIYKKITVLLSELATLDKWIVIYRKRIR